jgi:hypothetical protein
MKDADWEKLFDLNKVIELVERIRPILAGNPSVIQGAVIGELTATWIVGHSGETEKETTLVRAKLLAVQVQVITNLVNLKEKL